MNNQEKMFRLIEEQRESGLSARAFCQQQEIKYTTSNYPVPILVGGKHQPKGGNHRSEHKKRIVIGIQG